MPESESVGSGKSGKSGESGRLLGFGSVDPETSAERANERHVVESVQAGDTQAFNTLVQLYSEEAYAIAFRLMRHREDAEDAVQETFMKVLDNISRFDADRPFAPWFFRILRNQVVNDGRKKRVRQTDEIPDSAETNYDGADVRAERSEFLNRFSEAVNALPDRQRVVVELHDVDGLTSVEIGNALEMPSATVRWYLQRARRALRSAMAPFHSGTDVETKLDLPDLPDLPNQEDADEAF